MTIIKICGIQTVEHALAAATAGADWIGLVFAPSRRQVSADQASALVTALREHEQGRRVKVVGLFVHEQPAQINALIARCALDYVQLSGVETREYAVAIRCPVIKSVRLDNSPEEDAWIRLAQTANQHQLAVERQTTAQGQIDDARFAIRLLVDAHVPGQFGGTGARADWCRAAALAQQQALILAGGLTPGNVAVAMTQVRPWGVDVSSGVETDGIKDCAKISAFVQAVHAHDFV
ncbi:MAG: phosphoribosylanthranilate isomerase [Chloroflexales bacterium]|nr:phosphoribosylanthranilate isomerase [Chloroflexales bacterium]